MTANPSFHDAVGEQFEVAWQAWAYRVRPHNADSILSCVLYAVEDGEGQARVAPKGLKGTVHIGSTLAARRRLSTWADFEFSRDSDPARYRVAQRGYRACTSRPETVPTSRSAGGDTA